VETNRSSIGYEETTHPQGAIGGVQIGYNWQGVSVWIFGLEADFQASGEDATGNVHQNTTNVGGGGGSSGSGSFGFEIFNSQSISHNDRLDWFGTVRGRVG
jgi:outer membrane immunogenic protein